MATATKATKATIAPANKVQPRAKAIAAPVAATNAPTGVVLPVAPPAPAAAPAATPAAPKAGRYAPTAWGPNHVITFKPNPKRAGTHAHTRYALHVPGQTVAQYVAACAAYGQAHAAGAWCNATIANLDLRWGVAHGFYTLTAPQE
jgi:hypothetical protein